MGGLILNVRPSDAVVLHGGARDSVNIRIGGGGAGASLPAYDGPTRVTPSAEAQVLLTKNTSVYSDILVDPVPSNYGLITWNGSTLTVS
ncbi:MAG: hypothetical protein J6S63_01500 [Atopobiaceae bacterium]|nr:hypothetical protein [Atopobiaceae bacterium]